MSKVVAPKGQRCSYCDNVLTQKDKPMTYKGEFFCDKLCMMQQVASDSQEVVVK